MNNKKIFAITGGIGSGKSFVLSVLKKVGYYTLSSDVIVSELYQKNSVKAKLKKIFPNAVSGVFNLKLDKAVIANTVFSDKEKHFCLTSTITPLVLKEIKKRTKRLSGLIFVEVPLLFECNYQNEFDGVIVVKRVLTERVKSVINRSNLTKEQVLERISKQVDYDNIDLTNYIVLENNTEKEQFEKEILALAQSLEN